METRAPRRYFGSSPPVALSSCRSGAIDCARLDCLSLDFTATAITTPCEWEHLKPDSRAARLFPSVVLAVAPAVTMDEASSVVVGRSAPNLKRGTVCVCGMSGLRNGMNTTQHLPSPASRAEINPPTNGQVVSRAIWYANTHRPRFQIRARPSYLWLELNQQSGEPLTLVAMDEASSLSTACDVLRASCCGVDKLGYS